MKHLKLIKYFSIAMLSLLMIVACANPSTFPLKFTDQHRFALGLNHVVALKKDGTVLCHIRTTTTNSNVHREDECFVTEWNDIVSLAAGEVFTAGLKSDGTLVITGNESIQEKIAEWKDIVEIEAIGQNLMGLRSDGTVMAMTVNPSWYGTSENKDFNEELSKWKDVTGIFAGVNVLHGVKGDGSVLTTWSDDAADLKDIKDIANGYFFRVYLSKSGDCYYSGAYEKIETTLSDCADIKDLSVGYFDIAGLKNDGTVITATMVENDASWDDLSSWRDIIEIANAWGTVIGLKNDGTFVSRGLSLEDKDVISKWTDIGIPD